MALKIPSPPRPPAPPKGMGRRSRLGNTTRTPLRAFGPRFLQLGKLPGATTDWCVAPSGFVGAHTSLPEWMIYKAIARVTGDPPRPEEPPYAGGVNWTYQDPLLGGRLSKGGVVCDFLVRWGTDEVCIRLQSERYHTTAEIAKQQDELYEKTHGTRTIDIYEQDFRGDCSGAAACRVVAEALAGRDAPDPVARGTVRQVRQRGGPR